MPKQIDHQKVANLLQAGHSTKDVAVIAECSTSTVKRIRRALFRQRGNPWSASAAELRSNPDALRRAIITDADHDSVRAIAARYGVSTTYVHKTLRETT